MSSGLRISGRARSGVRRMLRGTLLRFHGVALLLSIAALFATLAFAPASAAATPPAHASKSDPLVERRATLPGKSQVIVRAVNTASPGQVAPIIERAGGNLKRQLAIINSQVAEVPNGALKSLANDPLVARVSLDRFAAGAMERTGITIGATAVRQALGYDGFGVGVAIIDSGVSAWHDDLTGAGQAQRVVRFVDFVRNRSTAYDDYGHGTHVAGIVAGNGYDSSGARSGVAPAANLIVLKALDGSGRGRISDVIAALDYAVANKDALNIRVVNLSLATGVYESYNTDPLTLAAQRVVAAGIVVVAAAGNNGRSENGRALYGGTTAPGNAPWVLTVGASSHAGTIDRADDTMAVFSSRGPTAIDDTAKPDLVAPGVGIESLSDPESALYSLDAPYLLSGTIATAYRPYLSLSGTSMAAPVVSGTVALMVQANPALTPNQVKAILQYTALVYAGPDALTQGAGFLNAKGAVELASYLAAPSSTGYPSSSSGWGRRLIWGNRLVRGGRLTSGASAWSTAVNWGALKTPNGQSIEWGVLCSGGSCDSGGGALKSWSVTCSDQTCNSATWTGDVRNVVWGTTCGGGDCNVTWSVTASGDALILSDKDTVVWGTFDVDTVVWGTLDADTVVWGTFDADTVVWGTTCNDPACAPVVWSGD
jgi:serine protease AprX